MFAVFLCSCLSNVLRKFSAILRLFFNISYDQFKSDNDLYFLLYMQLMLATVAAGDELMPHRNDADILANSQPGPSNVDNERAVSTTPIRKLSRNRGLVLQEQAVVEDSPENDNSARAAAIRKGKRKLTQD